MTTSSDKALLTIDLDGRRRGDLIRFEKDIRRSKEIKVIQLLLRYKSNSTDYSYARRMIEAAERNPCFPSVKLFLELDSSLDSARALLGYRPTAIKSLLFLRASCYYSNYFERDFLAYQIALLPSLRDLTYFSGSLQSRRLFLEILAYSATTDTFRLERLNVATCLLETDLSERHRRATIQTASFFTGIHQFLTSPNGSQLRDLSIGLVGPVTAEEHLLFVNLQQNKSIKRFTCFFIGNLKEERCKTIGHLIRYSQSMKHVLLACDNFRDEMMVALADSLRQNTSMEHLELYFFPRNSIQDCLMELTIGSFAADERAGRHPEVSTITKSLIQRSLPLKTLFLTTWKLSDESLLGLIQLIGSPQLRLEKLKVVSSFSGKMAALILNELTTANGSLMSVHIKQIDSEDLCILEPLQFVLQRMKPNLKELNICCSPLCRLSLKQHREIAIKWKGLQPEILACAKANIWIEKLRVEVNFEEHVLLRLDDDSLDENAHGENYLVSITDSAQRRGIVMGLLNLKYGENNYKKDFRDEKPDSQWDRKGLRLRQELQALCNRNIRANRIALYFIQGSATLAELPFALSRIILQDDAEMASSVALSHVQRLLIHFATEILDHLRAKSDAKISGLSRSENDAKPHG